MEDLKEEFDNITLFKLFEIEVSNNATKETEYLIFDISVSENKLVAQHEALNEDEAKSEKIAFKSINLDIDSTLDENLQGLYEECTQAILDSEFFTLK